MSDAFAHDPPRVEQVAIAALERASPTQARPAFTPLASAAEARVR